MCIFNLKVMQHSLSRRSLAKVLGGRLCEARITVNDAICAETDAHKSVMGKLFGEPQKVLALKDLIQVQRMSG